MHTLLHIVLCFAALTTVAPAASAERVIRFPEQSVGSISIKRTSSGEFRYAPSDTNIYEGWSPLTSAEGEVIVPDDVFVRLELDRKSAGDLAWVVNLAADAVDALSAFHVPVDDSGVRRLSHLTGLKI